MPIYRGVFRFGIDVVGGVGAGRSAGAASNRAKAIKGKVIYLLISWWPPRAANTKTQQVFIALY